MKVKSLNSKWVISLESTSPTHITIPSPNPYYIVLATNQPAPVQDSEPLRDQGVTDSMTHILTVK